MVIWRCRHSKLGSGDSFGLFCVFDGHNGVAAAQHIHDTLVEVRFTEGSQSPAPESLLAHLPVIS